VARSPAGDIFALAVPGDTHSPGSRQAAETYRLPACAPQRIMWKTTIDNQLSTVRNQGRGCGVGRSRGMGAGRGVGLGRTVAVGVGVGVTSDMKGAKTLTVTGEPVLKKPMVALLETGAAVESNRKLYSVPQRIALAFGFCAKVSENQVPAEPLPGSKVHGALL